LLLEKFSVVFCSSDRDQGQFGEYFGEMPDSWYAIPPSDKRKEQLSTLFEVGGIPSLVILDAATGKTINGNARGLVASDPEGASFPWAPPAVADLSSPDGINETPSLCLLVEGAEAAQQEALLDALTPIAEEFKAKLTKQSLSVGKFFSGNILATGTYLVSQAIGNAPAMSFGYWAAVMTAVFTKFVLVDRVFNPVGGYVWIALYAAAAGIALTA